MEQRNSNWNVTIFGNRLSWKSDYSIYSVYSTSESGIAGRAGIAEINVMDLDGTWKLIPEQNDFCSIWTGIGGLQNAYSRYSSSWKVSKKCGLSFLVELEIVKIEKNSYFSCNTYLYIKYGTSATRGISKPLGVDITFWRFFIFRASTLGYAWSILKCSLYFNICHKSARMNNKLWWLNLRVLLAGAFLQSILFIIADCPWRQMIITQ